VVLRQNHKNRSHRLEAEPRETVDLGFEARPRNPSSSSPCARCKPHTASPDLSIVRSSSPRSVLDHHQSFTPNLLLIPRSSSLPTMPHMSPTHHETTKHVSPHKTDSRIEPPKFFGFKFKQGKLITITNQTNVLTTWFLNFYCEHLPNPVTLVMKEVEQEDEQPIMSKIKPISLIRIKGSDRRLPTSRYLD
jgi:hypothetical protein